MYFSKVRGIDRHIEINRGFIEGKKLCFYKSHIVIRIKKIEIKLLLTLTERLKTKGNLFVRRTVIAKEAPHSFAKSTVTVLVFISFL